MEHHGVDKIDDLSSREIDALVHEYVLGFKLDWEMTEDCDHIALDGKCPKCLTISAEHPYDIPDYSADIAVAWKIIDQIPFRVEITEYDPDDGPRWMVKMMGPGHVAACEEGDSAARALCVAALNAVGCKRRGE